MSVPLRNAWKKQKARATALGKPIGTRKNGHVHPTAGEHTEPVEVPISYPYFSRKLKAAADKVTLSYDVFTLAAISATTGLSLEQVEQLKRVGILPAPTKFRRYQYGYGDADYHLICDAIEAALEDAELEDKSWTTLKEDIRTYLETNRALYQSHPFTE